MITNERPRRYVSSRYASRYETPDGSLPEDATPEDIFPEDSAAMQLAKLYFDKGESLIKRVNWFTRYFLFWRYRSVLERECAEAENIARIVHSEGSPLIAAFVRVAHSFTGPANEQKRNRLIDISIAASRNTKVPLLKRHDLT